MKIKKLSVYHSLDKSLASFRFISLIFRFEFRLFVIQATSSVKLTLTGFPKLEAPLKLERFVDFNPVVDLSSLFQVVE